MSKQQNRHTEEFWRETVRLLESSGKSVPELAREMGLNEKSLYRWRKKYSIVGSSSTTAPNTSDLEAELKRLQRENEVLRQERDILKKAISIVSRSQP